MAATHALGACVERRVGSSPTLSTNASLTQLVECLAYTENAGGSSPSGCTKQGVGGRAWLNVPDLKSDDPKGSVGSNPTLPSIML
jgi:hypothetical protein